MVKKNSLFFDFNRFISGQVGSVSGVTLEILLFFIEKHKKPIQIIANQTAVERISVVYQNVIGEKVLTFLAPQQHNVDHFVNFFDDTTSISTQAVLENPALPSFIDKNIYNKPLIPNQTKEKFNITKDTHYEELLDCLSLLKYRQTEGLLSTGFFTIRGGAIDVFPYNRSTVIRFSFLDDFCSIYSVKNNNQIHKNLISFTLKPKFFQQKKSLMEVFSDKRVLEYDMDACCLFFDKNPSFDLNSQPVDYQMFVKNFKGHDCELLQTNTEVGFLVKNKVFIPRWFLGLDKKIERPISFLRGKTSLISKGIYIHDDFGFCKYLGLEKLKQQERICLQFADGVVKLDVYYISKLSFCSSNENNIQLSFLNKPGVWKQKKQKAYDEALLYTKELLKTYSERELVGKKNYNTLDPFIEDFVRAFKHKDTVDQRTCWSQLLEDFNNNKPINRLICGDVGFGKTEIAIRAAFLSVFNNEPVLVLAPTTLLANQLYHCFVSRTKGFGLSVGCLSRLSSKPQKTTESFMLNKLDVLIGTSSLLFKPELLKKCGLFIVDEEHRFGVKDKELIFKLNPSVNFIAMSATPLPRSLELSLKKVRNFSTIKTPPLSRKPTISSVCFYNLDFLTTIILNEFSRKGQVYFVDNSVKNLRSIFNKLIKKLPGLRLGLVFGSMDKKSLISNMDAFVQGKLDVLLTTTIIESGIDIGSTNTIIVNNAHLFGLSQLYQLRGRVGRSSTQAFCWFLVPKNKITDDGYKRLKAIIKHSSLGEGYNIALADLNIRGAGSLFGYKQSGSGGVGFEFYSKLLALAVKGEGIKTHQGCVVDLNNKPLSSSFIQDENTRAFYYKTIFTANKPSDLQKIKKEIVALFGSFPKELNNLFLCRKLSFLGASKNIKSIMKKGGSCVVSFSFIEDQHVPLLIEFINSFFSKQKLVFKFLNSHKSLIFQYQNSLENDYILMKNFINKLPFC